MNVVQIVVKTIISTIDLLLILGIVKSDNMKNGFTKTAILLVVMNVIGVWF